MAHARVGCLCTGIKLIRLIQAIDNGANSFEEVKAVTGIGAGYCRGKRCGAKVRELLAQKRYAGSSGADPVSCPLDFFTLNEKNTATGIPATQDIRCGPQGNGKEAPMIIKVLEGDTFLANCYIVASATTRRAMIIDPGVQAGRILATIKELDLSLAFIALTHAHLDHVSAFDSIRKKTNALFIASSAETEAASADPPLVIPGLTFTPFQFPYKPDRELKDHDTVELDDLSFTVLHTPGHSADSVCYYGHGVLFSGDTLLKGKIGTVLPGLFPGHDHQQLKKSITKKLMALPDDTLVYPGHGAPTTIGAERQH
ncbi:MBL fold metallo-hydrolase [Desulfobulbus alkaliphilus]|uniref:MBL fold metallo-hydrolase n=1 Tax=Desulfobulbus alkaliphilus TaxID=869814 RepID=UPI001F0524E6|nr:MBL fold metallo-hydrolase [Desulfobulbus alkaliphilus]